MVKEASFDALVAAIQDAFITVNKMSENQHLEMLKAYFDEQGNPRSIDMQYPCFDKNGQVSSRMVKIPMICLVPISSLKLEEIAVNFKVKLYGRVYLEKKGKEDDGANAGENSRELLGLKEIKGQQEQEKKTFLGYVPNERVRKSSGDSYADIQLKFTSQEPPEGLLRIRDEFIKVSL